MVDNSLPPMPPPQPAPKGTVIHQHHTPRRREHNIALVVNSDASTKRQNALPRSANPSCERLRTKTTTNMPVTNINTTISSTHINRGHQFTVGNISNGLIYLRPVIRPTHELHYHKFALPPSTPPSSAEEINGGWQRDSEDRDARTGRKTPPGTPPRGNSASHNDNFRESYLRSSPPVPPTRQKRAHSYSTAAESDSAAKEATFAGFRVKIEQLDGPGGERRRPRTTEHQNSFQSIDVQIPHYNLGSPHFSPNGTPFLYGSSSLHVPSTQGELGGSSSDNSHHTDVRWLWPGADPRSFTPSSMFSHGSPQSIRTNLPHQNPAPLMSSPSLIQYPSRTRITPEMFDSLSFPPASEHPSIVRYDSRTQEISAATPARIIAQITSATFVDYHLLSDFFLTFRLFMTPPDLVSYLVSRLRWAVHREDDTGKVVRVRTFVAIRHWLLNYFADDFVPSLPLREEFVRAMNELSTTVRGLDKPSDMKIIGELKKCWRRTCALYWDAADSTGFGIDQEILPGGPPGKKGDISTRPPSSILRRPRTPPPRIESTTSAQSSGTESFIRDVMQGSAAPKDPRNNGRAVRRDASIASSTHAKPSSLPCLSPQMSRSSSGHPTEPAHSPSPIKLTKANTAEAATSVQTFIPKSLRPSSHKRSGSFSDALRDNRQPLPLPKSIARSTHLLMAFPYTGSLVRGNLFQPTPAYVEVVAPSTPVNELMALEAGARYNSTQSSAVFLGRAGVHDAHAKAHAQGGPGVKKFLGSVRRALSGKSPPGSNGINSPVPGGRTARRSNLGLTSENSSISRFMAENTPGGGMGVRIDGKRARVDLLGAGAVDAFQRAMQEETEGSREDEEQSFRDISSSELSQKREELQIDGAIDSCTDLVVEIGSTMASEAEISILAKQETPATPSPLKRPRENNTQRIQESVIVPERNPDSPRKFERQSPRVHDTPENDSQRSIITTTTPSIPLGYSHQPRKSKSFSFEQTASRFSRPYRSILEGSTIGSPFSGIDELALRSVQSFPLVRENSGLGQRNSAIDDGSVTFSYSSSPRSILEGNFPRSRMLRRRPGGDLKAAATVGDLEMPRPKTAGSVETGNFSMHDSSYFRRSDSMSMRTISKMRSVHPRLPAGVLSLGAVAKNGGLMPRAPSPPLDPFSGATIPAVPNTKEAFEAGVKKLRNLPDSENDDDGGIEIALMKLEGTYKWKKTGQNTPLEKAKGHHHSTHSRDSRRSLEMPKSESGLSERSMGLDGANDSQDESKYSKRRHKQIVDEVPLQTPPILSAASARVPSSDNNSPRITLARHKSSSILERGMSVSAFGKRSASPSNNSGSVFRRRLSSSSAPVSDQESHPQLNETGLDQLNSELTKHLASTQERELRDDVSELSSEISFEVVQSENGSSKFPPMQPGTIIAELGIPSHPLRHPPSPPLTLEQAKAVSPGDEKGFSTVPLTPQRTPRADVFPGMHGIPGITIHNPSETTSRPGGNSEDLGTSIFPTSIHLPFILAYDSELLAKQFTLIEKDALMEVDWKELVELRWTQTNSSIQDWVEFLNSKDIRGVEVVIARFNLMCKWASSEIVMTKNTEERVRTVVKFIHIAAHARRLQNYATMYQITIALLTADVARLRQTWSLIAPADMATFRELEALVQPTRNFHNLRTEMDKVTGESGCIPFVGIFTHDLILNAQRPSLIASTPAAEPLVNFERHRTTAAIIKRLLRLIEASHKYDFKAVDGVCERCLWVASLSEVEIRGLSKRLEQ